jgi:paraquat-inducible protein B
MAIKYDAIVKNGTYKDKNTGEDRTNWLKVGVVVETRNGGLALKIESLPPLWDGWVQLATPKSKEQSVPQENTQTQQQSSMDDPDIPF